ncbi:unnamed protein product [Angiostrongylus costaricensis]|uniref:Uncharacterized protein n=1 Tax=Angiostrongylus costaricensis TaxID=334426 RepID=A0A0R3Q1A7_ANGCS|nr:unnamed protein product [Angiostrongylus costaricensis]
MRWAGHVMRMNENRWTGAVSDWIPRDVKRTAGRPPTCWVREQNYERNCSKIDEELGVGSSAVPKYLKIIEKSKKIAKQASHTACHPP